MAKKRKTIPSTEIKAARNEHALFELARKYGRTEEEARPWVAYTMRARVSLSISKRDYIAFSKRKEAYKKGKEI
jgi:hypothetical protein